MARVTQHAAERYAERINADIDPVAAIMAHEGAIERAAAFGCTSIRLGDGTRLRLKGNVVVTVVPQMMQAIPRRLLKSIARKKRVRLDD